MEKEKKDHHCFAVKSDFYENRIQNHNAITPGPEHAVRHKMMCLRLLIDAVETNLKKA